MKLRSGKHRLALLSRCRDNLYICLAIVPDQELELVKMILARGMPYIYIYGIPLMGRPFKGMLFDDVALSTKFSFVALLNCYPPS